MMKPQQQFEQMLMFFSKHGVTHVNFAALHHRPDGSSFMLHNNLPRSIEEAKSAAGWARSQNASKHDIYIRPARFLDRQPASWPMVFLDDVPPPMANSIAAKYCSCVITTSPARCHVWIATQLTLNEQQRAIVQAALVQRLHAIDIGYADAASTSGEHFGRPPGFKNHKRGGVWVNLATISSAGKLDASPYLSSEASPSNTCLPPASLSPHMGGRVLHKGVSSCSGHSPSEDEFGWAIGYLRWAQSRGLSIASVEAHVIQVLQERALARGKRRTPHAAEDYARRTCRAALQALGY